MSRIALLLLMLGSSVLAMGSTEAQETHDHPEGLHISNAEKWGTLVLKGLDTEFPTKLSLMYTNENQIQRPKEHFPAFFGCFD